MTQALLRKCVACGAYTLKAACPHCGAKAGDPRPAKFSPEDHYGQYRRDLKRLSRKEVGAKAASAAPEQPAGPSNPSGNV